MVEGPPKTDAGDRTCPPARLCDDLSGMLTARVIVTEQLVVPGPPAPATPPRPLQGAGHPAALRAAGLPETIRTYDLRHSHASLLIDLGANPLAVAQRMGHSDAAFTLRVYGHLFEGVQAKLSEPLDALRIKTANTPQMGVVVNLTLAVISPKQDSRDPDRTRVTAIYGHERLTWSGVTAGQRAHSPSEPAPLQQLRGRDSNSQPNR